MKPNYSHFTFLIVCIAFIEGLSLMCSELVVAKLMATYFGNSIYVWSSVLAITIASLTCGYFAGAFFSKKPTFYKFITPLFLCTAILFCLLPFFAPIVLDFFVNYSLKSGALFSAFILIFPLVFMFGMISPILIRTLTKQSENAGKNASLVYSISTLGGILMTFSAGFYLIPFWGIKFTCILISTFLFLAFTSIVICKKLILNSILLKNEKQSFEKLVQPKLSKQKITLYLAAFLEGVMVIVVELIGSKLLIPFVGNSLLMWTSVIGLTISFLTLGYFVGGKLTQRKNLLKWITFSFSLTAILLVLMPYFSGILIANNIDGPLLQNGILLTSLIIGPPIFFLGLTTPLIIQMLTEKAEDSGSQAGKVYALSSLGGVIMTLFLGMYLIPEFGLQTPIYFLSLLLILSSLVILFSWRQVILFLTYASCLLIVYSKNKEINWESDNSKVQYISESLLGQLKVYDEFFPLEELEYRYLFVNGICQTMIVNNKEVVSAWKYIHRISRIASLKSGSSALLFGMGGGSVASELNKLHFKTDIVDIDPRMFEICKKYFYFKDSSSHFFVDDARHFIRKSQKKYDLIILDLLSGENQPSNVFTKEGLKNLIHLMKDDGLIVFNFQELKKNGYPISAHASINNTLLSLGLKVQYHKSNGVCPDIITVISKKDIDLEHIKIENLSPSFKYLGDMQALIQEPFIKVIKPVPNGIIFYDDKPILDVLNSETLKFWRKDAISSFVKKALKNKNPLFN